VWFALDAALVKSPFGAEKIGKKPTVRGKLGSNKSMIVDQKGAPLGIAVGAANTHDSRLVRPTLRSFYGSFKEEKLKVMALDQAYDAMTVKNDLKKMKFIPLISINQRRSKKNPEKHSSRYRWIIIERSHGWLNHFRSLRTRWARCESSFLALFEYACV